jgi:TonB family protein
VQIAERRDVRRLAVAVAAAILVHVGLIFAIPFLTSLDTAPLPDYGPIVVTLEDLLPALEPPPPPPKPVIAPAPKPVPAKPAPAVKPAPAAPTTTKAATAAPAASTPTRAPGTSAFRQSGATTGTSAGPAPASVAPGPPPVTLPPARGSTTPGSGEQRSGEAVATGAKPAGSGGSLKAEIAKVDSSIARAAPTGSTGAAPAASGATGGTAATGANIEWEDPDAAKGRELLSWPEVRLPDTVKRTGFVLQVRVAFSVNADGLVTSPRVVQGSGYPDVDAACLDALKKAKFTPAKGAVELNGSRTIRITLR